MSKPCDSHATVVKKELRGAALPGADLLWPEKGSQASAVLPDAGGVSRECDEVKAMVAPGMIARASLLSRAFTT